MDNGKYNTFSLIVSVLHLHSYVNRFEYRILKIEWNCPAPFEECNQPFVASNTIHWGIAGGYTTGGKRKGDRLGSGRSFSFTV
jgi:hypothetical protein